MNESTQETLGSLSVDLNLDGLSKIRGDWYDYVYEEVEALERRLPDGLRFRRPGGRVVFEKRDGEGGMLPGLAVHLVWPSSSMNSVNVREALLKADGRGIIKRETISFTG